MTDLTKDQRQRIDAAKDELRRRVQQMISCGIHDFAAVKHAMEEIVRDWK
jgi:hydrogenase maturation factor